MAVDDKDLEEANDLSVAPIVGPDDPRRFTDSGIEIQPIYTADDVPDDLDERLGDPAEFPFTRGVHREMYRKQLWTMRQYAGYASAKESNERYRYLLKNGCTGLSMAFDLPTQLGLDSDDPRCLGEVGRTGVAIDSLDDMRTAFDGIPLDEVSTSMTINAPAAVLLLLYQLVGEEQGVDPEKLRGTTQNDILKEYIARGNFIYPPEPSMRLVTDLFAYCADTIPKWNTVSISGYHFREKGCSAVQEVAFTLANGMAYVQAALDAGLSVDDFAPRLAFFFNGHNNVFQEVAKFRAARKLWAEFMRDRFGAESPKSQSMRFHTQTGGVTLTAQQPANNIVRVALQGFAAVAGGTQSLHTNGYDEALALPSERAAKIALRTQQIIAHESGAADTVDPFAGSYYVEALTKEIEDRSRGLIEKIDEMGGSVNAIAFIKSEIEESAFGYHERYRTKQDIVVGVNKYEEEDVEVEDILRVDPESEREQVERLKAFKEGRDQEQADQAPRGAAGGRPRRREPPAADPRRAQGPLLGRRGLRRDARGVRRVPARIVKEAELRETETGLVPEGKGWFVLNLRDASWETMPGGGTWVGFQADGVRAADRRRRARAAARRGARPLPRRGQPGGLPGARPASASSWSRARSGGSSSGTTSTARPGRPTSPSAPATSRARSSCSAPATPGRRSTTSPTRSRRSTARRSRSRADSAREAYADQDRTYTPVKAPWPGT